MEVFADLSCHSLRVCVTSTVVGDGYLGDQRPSSQASNLRSPQFDWGSAPTGDEEGPQDLRGRPLSMSLKRALWYEAFGMFQPLWKSEKTRIPALASLRSDYKRATDVHSFH